MWFEFTKIAPKMKAQIFFGGHLFWGSLGEIWAKVVLEVP